LPLLLLWHHPLLLLLLWLWHHPLLLLLWLLLLGNLSLKWWWGGLWC
jgi:hypothetical protein